MRMLTVVLLAMLACVGCDNKKEAAPGTKPEKAAEAPKVVTKPADTIAAVARAEADDDIPTTADFEEAAEKEIDNASVEAEVDKLAKEIGE